MRRNTSQNDDISTEGLGPRSAVVLRFESTPMRYPLDSLGTKRSQPHESSSGESHFLYSPSGKHPLFLPLSLYHLQFLQVRPELLLRDARTIISSCV